ncbi:hypothetical protein [Caulobacter hibisci]|uniref:Uncharacterized protein n=1 Tax=Caulobacter hibisci TaxID=2035993 RepID=A0ABS0T2X7_9CAUL|nr:hypothetical protein [Caulobacter hibisci]MBI1685207.1 hypothetical protein [Caulobacter hibisci]
MSDHYQAYWRDMVRDGVQALGFFVQKSVGPPQLMADLADVELEDSWKRRAAYAALAVHKEAVLETAGPLALTRAALLAALEKRPAMDELSAYQEALIEAVWQAVKADPAPRIEALGYAED